MHPASSKAAPERLGSGDVHARFGRPADRPGPRRDQRHIISIEDPVEYEHPHGTSLIEQVEIGVDGPDFATALRAAELLMVSYGARQHIRKSALQHLNQEITITRKAGSFTLEESLAVLVRTHKLDRRAALMKAAHPDELTTLLAG